MINILNNSQIKSIKLSAKILNNLLLNLKSMIKPGVSGLDLDNYAAGFLKTAKAKSNFKNYHHYPAYLCVSVNQNLIHGIPNKTLFKNGDIVSVDAGCVYAGMHSDAAFTTIVGVANSDQDQILVQTTHRALALAISVVKPGVRVGLISHTIQHFVEQQGFYLTSEYAGHGIGHNLHEDPMIPNVGAVNNGVKLQSGMVICIEPMVQIKDAGVKTAKDNWTVYNITGYNSAHYEAMVLVTPVGHEVLTPIIK